jgi:aminoglycoside phosphotransferase (APT) family kinase protein
MSAEATDAQARNSGDAPVRANMAFDEGRLAEWMRAHVDGFSGPLSVSQFAGGQSNPTYRIATPGRDFVLRRRPPGKLAAGAHAVDREARVITALGAVGFPVPAVHGLCIDDAVIGSAFYLMDFVAGRIIWDAALPQVAREERAAHFDAMNATLARLHQFDPEAIGLGDYGKAGNYFERQVARWLRQYHADAPEAGREPQLERLLDWLPDRIPTADETRVVHGDFRCDNMVFHPTEPRVIAVLDWELSTLGNPLADFGYHLMMYRMPPMAIAGLVGTDLGAAGIPSEASYVEAYCRRTGRGALAPDELNFLVAFNMFRLATIIHGIKARLTRGNASSAHAGELVRWMTPLAHLACEQAGLA